MSPHASEGARLHSVVSQLTNGNLPPRLLNVGCGSYPCADILRNTRPDWVRWGLDRDEEALRHAYAHDQSLCLICADANDAPELLRPMRGEFGLVLVRHPDLFRTRCWQSILPRLHLLLAPDAALVVTVYTPEEAEIVRRMDIPHPVAMDESQLASVDFAGHDRFVYVFRRES